MVTTKTPQEISVIKEGGSHLARILDQVLAAARPGIMTKELDQLAERLIIEVGGQPSFKGYRGRPSEPPFPGTICASVNEQLVHTPAGNYILREGDILSVDIGMKYPARGRGFYTDMARTIPMGEVSPQAAQVIKVTEEAFRQGVAQVKVGKHVSDIGKAIQAYVESAGFSVVRQLVGHGVGYAVHESPRVPNFHDPKLEDVMLQAGMVLAIEPMVNVGEYLIKILDDGWTVVTADGSLCAHHENTLVVTEDGCQILTGLEDNF